MKRFTVITLAVLLFSGTASAQTSLFQGGAVLGELLGPSGVVLSLVESLQQASLKPTINAAAGGMSESLAQGAVSASLNKALTGLLVIPPDPQAVATGLSGAVTGLVGGLLRALTGSSFFGSFGGFSNLLGNFGGFGSFSNFGGFGGLLGSAMLTASGQGMSPGAIPLKDIAPGTQTALVNGVKLQGL